MATQFEYTLTRYSRKQARRQISRTSFLYAENFAHAVAQIEFGMRAAHDVDTGWEYEIEGIKAIGFHGERNEEPAGAIWPVDVPASEA